MTDPNPELDGAGGGAEDLELVLNPNEPEAPKVEDDGLEPELGDDPLDDIKDEVARAEAKKARAIVRRAVKKDAPPKPKLAEPVKPTEEPLTKADFHKINERAAIKQVTSDPEIKAIWNEIAPLYYSRRGKESAADIIEDINDAITLYKARNPEIIVDDSKNELTATPVVKTAGGPAEKTAPKKELNLPGFSLPAQPSDWYGKKKDA